MFFCRASQFLIRIRIRFHVSHHIYLLFVFVGWNIRSEFNIINIATHSFVALQFVCIYMVQFISIYNARIIHRKHSAKLTDYEQNTVRRCIRMHASSIGSDGIKIKRGIRSSKCLKRDVSDVCSVLSCLLCYAHFPLFHGIFWSFFEKYIMKKCTHKM